MLKMDDRIPRAAPLVALALGTLFVIAAYYPILAPLGDPSMAFVRGDFTTIGGNNSGQVRMEQTFSTFSGGTGNRDTNRFILLGGLSAFAAWGGYTDAQFNSAIILLSTLLGCIGIYMLMTRLVDDWRYCAAAILVFIPFYFLNLWSVERIGHVWIWFTYAVFPLFMAIGFSYISGRRNSTLIAYSVLFAFYGAIPHSFMYLGMLHAFHLIFSLASGSGWKSVAKFAVVPVVIYALLTFPFLLELTVMGNKYPQEITKESFTYLSKNGDLANLLAMTNNWWPSLDEERIQSSFQTRYASFGIFMLVFGTLAFAYPALSREQKALCLMCAIMIAACMFVAQGDNNQIVKWFSGRIVDAGMGLILAPFREWARISLLIPPMAIVLLGLCIMAVKQRGMLMLILASLVAANIFFSPSWEYLQRIHGAVGIGNEYSSLAAMLPQDSKTLWFGIRGSGIPANTTDGKEISARPPIPNAGDGYYPYPIIRAAQRSGAPEGLLDALNIRHIVKRAGTESDGWYGWMDCGRVGLFLLCNDMRDSEPFRAYSGVVVAGDEDVMSISHPGLGDYAVSDKLAEHAGYVVRGAGDASTSTGGLAEIIILEGESAFSGRRKAAERIGASNNTHVTFNGTLRAAINTEKGGGFRIAAMGSGPVNISIDGAYAGSADGESAFSYGEPFYLGAGAHNITAQGGPGSSLDVVWIIPYSENGTVSTLFRSGSGPPATVISFARDGPTRWHANVSANKPFLLAFSESYAQGWEARIIENGSTARSLRPSKLFGAINGYWVDRTGDLEIELRYTPQDLFESGLSVATAALFGSVISIAYFLWRGD